MSTMALRNINGTTGTSGTVITTPAINTTSQRPIATR